MALQDFLARCPRCRKSVILVYGEASYRNLALFEAVPWSPLDEPEPEPEGEHFTEAGRRRWLALLPFRLYVCYIDFDRGTWQVAIARSSEKLRQGQPLWKPHNCLQEVSGGMEPTKADLVPDRAAVAVDGGERRRPLADGILRRRSARVGRTRNGGV